MITNAIYNVPGELFLPAEIAIPLARIGSIKGVPDIERLSGMQWKWAHSFGAELVDTLARINQQAREEKGAAERKKKAADVEHHSTELSVNLADSMLRAVSQVHENVQKASYQNSAPPQGISCKSIAGPESPRPRQFLQPRKKCLQCDMDRAEVDYWNMANVSQPFDICVLCRYNQQDPAKARKRGRPKTSAINTEAHQAKRQARQPLRNISTNEVAMSRAE